MTTGVKNNGNIKEGGLINYIGYIDIENDEIEKYLTEAKKKIGVCKFLPCARFDLFDNSQPTFSGLVCSDKMGGERTGVAASECQNCILPTGLE